MEFGRRTLNCAQVGRELVGTQVTLNGWVNKQRDLGDLIFADVRDRTGLVQVVADASAKQAFDVARTLHHEDVVSVTGTVELRSGGENKNIASGAVEIKARVVEILNCSGNLPFIPDDPVSDEEIRLKYRYLDLRRPVMFQRLKLRSDIEFAMRQYLHEHDFIDVATPNLTKNTMEGAREFIVPSREHPGKFYALPQSPQLYKQLLMAGGIERYYQIARCFRDEDLRADRQPEFTQLDLEMSFINESDIQSVIEGMLHQVMQKIFNYDIKLPLQRMTFDGAFSSYGCDKPDLRFEMPIIDISAAFADTPVKFIRAALESNGKVGCLHVTQNMSRSALDALANKSQTFGLPGLVWIKYAAENQVESSIAKHLSTDFVARVKALIPAFKIGDFLILSAGEYKHTWAGLGRLRLELGKILHLIDPRALRFLWVTDFPMFEFDEKNNSWHAMHHPFTRPQAGWRDLPLDQVKARAYDIVLNGIEVGGGSIRIHEPQLQTDVFGVIGMNVALAQRMFGFLLEAQQFGFPPHGGIALGLDRLMMLLMQADSIREVIAFPKTLRGCDLLMDAPTQVEEHKLADYNLMFKKKAA